MGGKIWMAVCAVLAACDVLLVRTLLSERAEYAAVMQSAALMMKEHGTLYDNLVKTYESSAETLKTDTCLWKNEDEWRLVCRVSDMYCQTCNTYAVSRFVTATKRDEAHFLISAGTDGGRQRMMEDYGLEEEMVAMVGNELGITAELYGTAYYMVVDGSGRVKCTYFPNQATPEMDSVFIRKMAEECKMEEE